ncbi:MULTISPECIES: sugar phosphate isomerase/epimerase [unclassified Rothia (in: high G+C Gram-positive bacteria)]|uniref:sugar phosphate isomerase/epimerase family protein n=1 Tax=unclassified Rothia (in: high G+C Gram-positive bacteria) TaxID=2689056 RepID=UPI00195656E0|nr:MULTISPECIES: sugar phosphate isomerase/epimerase [unclassified Rothia (in: high G+C Gram-positive bacteria)]MBM7051956.1 sugar phosphate isomerase/epimerase [Rothia sp. ZJ1223]QRZ62524.1 sugar phosphate isomerase/epimerase [Rothia sp. ZJ932]
MSKDAVQNKIPVGLSTSCLFPLGVPETFQAAVDLGYDSVEVMITGNALSQEPQDLLDLVQKHQKPISAIHAPTLLLTQQVWGRAWNKMQMAARMTRAVGADVIVAHPPFRWQKTYAKNFVEGVRVVSEQEGVKIAVENMYPWSFKGKSIEMYAPHWDPTRFDYQWMTWDFSHAAASGADSLEMVKKMGSRLGHVHLTDGSGDKLMDEHLVPGHGNQKVAETLNYLRDTNWDGTVVAEVSTGKTANLDRCYAILTETLEFAHRHLGNSQP